MESNLAESEGQVTTVIVQSSSEAGDAERLTGGAADKKVNCSSSFDEGFIRYIS